MNPKLYPISSLFYEIIIVVPILIPIQVSLCAENVQYMACGEPFRCGNLNQNIGYPFWGQSRPDYCGHPGFQLQNCQGGVPLLTIQSLAYQVLAIDFTARTLNVARDDLVSSDTCPTYLHNTTLDWALFSYVSRQRNVTLLYGCPVNTMYVVVGQFDCTVNGTTSTSFYKLGVPSNGSMTCPSSEAAYGVVVIVPVNRTSAHALASNAPASIKEALVGGFELQWTANNTLCSDCIQSGGRCGSNSGSTSFVCYCADQPYALTCTKTTQPNSNTTQPQSNTTQPGPGIWEHKFEEKNLLSVICIMLVNLHTINN